MLAYQSYQSVPLIAGLSFILMGALSQSAIWPFHKWLLSSLNAPTPVSAVMHAGLVYGGGFLLARFAPLYLEASFMLSFIFAVGLASAVLGTLWYLMKNDVKRMLACSTMGQMGFMIAQCGLGLFPAAVAHLCWHGLYKAYLFLASGAAAQEKRLDFSIKPDLPLFALSLMCGFVGAGLFALVANKVAFTMDTTIVLLVVAVIAGAQIAMPIMRENPVKRTPLALLVTSILGLFYGYSVSLAQAVLAPLDMMQPQPLHAVHLLGICMLFVSWCVFLFLRKTSIVSHRL
jgi:NAD(P)H-quinone oxidoreductase subunit 5